MRCVRRLFPRLLPCLLLVLAVRGARGEDAPDAAPIVKVREAFAAYDEAIQGGGADSIPSEQAVLEAGASAARDGLVAFLGHARFGPLVLHVLVERPAAPVAAKVVEAYRAWAVPQRVEASIDLAALGDDPTRAALTALAAEAEVVASPAMAATVRAARLRAGDREVTAAVERALAAKDPDEVAGALVVVGDARATRFLPTAARLATDARALRAAIPSRWSETKTTTAEDGSTTSTSEAVELATLGAVALEAANRMCATTLPDFVAWWAEPEKGARFGTGPDGTKRLVAFVAEDAKAEKAKARRGLDAVGRVLGSLRSAASPEASYAFAGATFDRVWTVVGTLDGKPARHVVAADGTVTAR